jgi:hypothetical protein
MLVMWATKYPAYPLGKPVCPQQSVWFDDLALAVYPLGLYGVKPRAPLGQQATHDPHSASALLDFSVVPSETTPDLPGDVPARVVPDEEQALLSGRFELLRAPLEKAGGYGTHGPAVDESQPRLVDLWQVESVAADGLRLGGSSLATDRWMRRRGFPSSEKLLKAGKATRLHQHSSSKPIAHSGSGSATAISRSRLLFFFRTRGLGR